MKNVLIVLIFVGFFCVNQDQAVLDQIPRFETREEATEWVHYNIKWVLRENVNAWQSPELTMELKTGVCVDQSILLMYIFHEQFGDDPQMEAVRIENRPYMHSVVNSNNTLYDPSNNHTNYKYDYYYTINYNDIIFLASFNSQK